MSIEVPIGPNPAPALIRYTADGLNVLVSADRLTIGVQTADLGSIERAEAIATKALDLLVHTPITAVGVNLGFDEHAPSESLRALVRTPDLDPLSKFGCRVKATSVARVLDVDGSVLNATLTLDADSGSVGVALNFHHNVDTTDAAAKLLKGRASTCLKTAQNFMQNVYECTLEDSDEQA